MDSFIFAEVQDGIVINIIKGVDESSGSIIATMLPDSIIIAIDQYTGAAVIGSEFLDNQFRYPKTFDSWVWDAEQIAWSPPKPYPDVPSYWNEDIIDWVAIPQP